jgi:molecular chaperone GrpE
MNPDYKPNLQQEIEIEFDSSDSIDDFIKELEAKEKDLHISSEMVVEIEEFHDQRSEVENVINSLHNFKPPAPAPKQPEVSDEKLSDLEDEVSKLRQEVAKTSAEKNEIQQTFHRRQTDFENFRKRTDRERNEIFSSVLSNLAIKILPVIDNLNRALDSSEKVGTEKSNDFRNFIDGISLVNRQLDEVLEEMGIQPINSVGQPFDPHYHEAVATVLTDECPHNTVIEELVRGYCIDNRVIRPSMVKVSTSATNEVNTPQEANDLLNLN